MGQLPMGVCRPSILACFLLYAAHAVKIDPFASFANVTANIDAGNKCCDFPEQSLVPGSSLTLTTSKLTKNTQAGGYTFEYDLGFAGITANSGNVVVQCTSGKNLKTKSSATCALMPLADKSEGWNTVGLDLPSLKLNLFGLTLDLGAEAGNIEALELDLETSLESALALREQVDLGLRDDMQDATGVKRRRRRRRGRKKTKKTRKTKKTKKTRKTKRHRPHRPHRPHRHQHTTKKMVAERPSLQRQNGLKKVAPPALK